MENFTSSAVSPIRREFHAFRILNSQVVVDRLPRRRETGLQSRFSSDMTSVSKIWRRASAWLPSVDQCGSMESDRRAGLWSGFARNRAAKDGSEDESDKRSTKLEVLFHFTLLLRPGFSSKVFLSIRTVGHRTRKVNSAVPKPQPASDAYEGIRYSDTEQTPDERILASLAGALDRTLPVPLGIQLRGLIEFGIAWGELPTGQRLPSVRELAERAGIAYDRRDGLSGIARGRPHRAKPGAGTYVGDGHNSDGLRSSAIRKIQRRIETLFNEAEQLGLRLRWLYRRW